VQISSLRIDRFGVWSDFELEGISKGLNVLYGPPGSDLSAIIQFLRTTLFGFTNETRQRYMSTTFRSDGGSITIRGQFGRQTIRRRDDGDHHGRLVIENDDGPPAATQRLQELLASVGPSAFDRVFMPGFGKSLYVGKVIDAAVAHGFDLIDDSKARERLGDLRSRLAEKRRLLAGTERTDRPLEELYAARQNLTPQIKTLESSAAQQRESFDRLARKLGSEIRDLEEQLEELTKELNAAKAGIKTCEQEKYENERALEKAKLQQKQQLAELRRRLSQMSDQLKRWAHVLQDIEALDVELDEAPNVGEPSECDARGCLRRLEQTINLLDGAAEAGEQDDQTGDCHCHALQSSLRPALRAMREDVYRLCVELSQRDTKSQDTESPIELNRLRHRETELRQAALAAEIRRLSARCEEIRTDIDTIQDVLRQSHQRMEQLRMERGRYLRNESLNAKRGELDGIEQQIRSAERHRELNAAIVTLEEELRRLETATRRPSVLREASDLLRRLTAGELDEIIVTKERAVWVSSRQGNEFIYHQLGSDARDQVCLSMCLAVVAAYARQGVRLPVVLDDSLIHADSGAIETVASLLSDFAGRGHQVFLFTRHRHVADLFQSLDVPAWELPRFEASEVAAVEVDEKAVASDVEKEPKLSEEQRLQVNRQLSAIAEETASPQDLVDHPAWSAEEFPGELTDRVPSRQPAEPEPALVAEIEASPSQFFLQETSPIEDAPSIDSAIAECLRKIGVLQVGDLLQLNVEEAADRLRHAGVTAAMLRRWQAESLLACRVARLRAYDARILVACGITNPEQLAQTDIGELRRRVEVFGSTETGRVLLRSGTHAELSRVTGWIRSAKSRSDSEPVVLRMDKGREWKFFLNTNDPIERAPSIGPGTAKRFEAIGIRRVADFLAADPETTATRLDHRRIRVDTVKQWQQQTTLACRVPQLRGHDAQILVACGVTDPEALAQKDPKELWKTVEPFVETNEGKRIIRNGKSPDFEEVSDWIHWARHARKLRAA